MLKIEDREWKTFFMKDVFSNIQRGKRLKKEDQEAGSEPYISSTSLSNGVDNFIDNKVGVRRFSKCLTIANSGSVGATFFHPYDFVASDHVTHLGDDKFNQFSYLFVSTMLRRFSGKYNFNCEINDTRIFREKILLPVTPSGDPDYAFMEAYGKQLMAGKISEYEDYARKALGEVEHKEVPSIQDMGWKDFEIKSIFDKFYISRGIDLNKLKDGKIPFIGRSGSANGFQKLVDTKIVEDGNCLTVGMVGTFMAYFQCFQNFTCSQNMMILRGCYNKYVYIFISSILNNKLLTKYSYGKSIKISSFGNQKILLPITPSGEPDYAFMEQYAKNIYRKKIEEYLDYLGVVKASLQAQPQ